MKIFYKLPMDSILLYAAILISVATILYCNIRFGSPYYDAHQDDPCMSVVETIDD